ncbi:hypothetical protein BJF90_40995 [Pseudonocardia sp. CNS-004]|nr:hypothetical protein BJF90_40995 [Pseudonocardia sp. CNS-004]
MVNRGKDSVLLDVTTEAGKEVFWRLVDQADVVVQNFPPGTAERYGIGYAAVAARRPEIVYVAVSCYGGEGPWAPGRGYETQAQAVTGVMARAGGAGKPAVLGPYNLLDYGTGVLAAYAAVLGLHHRELTGAGLELRTSLVQTASHHQAQFLVDHPGAHHGGEPAGPDARGAAPHQRFFRAADQWLYVHAESADQLAGVEGLDGPDVAAAIAGRPPGRWSTRWSRRASAPRGGGAGRADGRRGGPPPRPRGHPGVRGGRRGDHAGARDHDVGDPTAAGRAGPPSRLRRGAGPGAGRARRRAHRPGTQMGAPGQRPPGRVGIVSTRSSRAAGALLAFLLAVTVAACGGSSEGSGGAGGGQARLTIGAAAVPASLDPRKSSPYDAIWVGLLYDPLVRRARTGHSSRAWPRAGRSPRTCARWT